MNEGMERREGLQVWVDWTKGLGVELRAGGWGRGAAGLGVRGPGSDHQL